MAGRHERRSRRGLDYNPALGQLRQMNKFDWERQLYGMQLDRTTRDVGFGLARHANADGSEVRPGTHRLMYECGIADERTIGKSMRKLRQLGLIYLDKPGGGISRHADNYLLTTHERVAAWTVTYETWSKERGFAPEDEAEVDPWAS